MKCINESFDVWILLLIDPNPTSMLLAIIPDP